MTQSENRNENTAVTEREISDTVARQVFEILEEDSQQNDVRQPVKPNMVYRVPSPGVRYYF